MSTCSHRVAIVAAASLAFLSVVAAPAGAASASPAAAAHWRVLIRYGNVDNQLGGLTTPSSSSGWAFGVHWQKDVPRSGFYLRWRGGRWRPAAVPHPRGFIPAYIASSSPANVWIAGQSNRPGKGGVNPDYVLIYNGNRWRSMRAPEYGQLAVAGPDSAWLFNGFGPVSSIDHWNGQRWSTTKVHAAGLGVLAAAGRAWFIGLRGITQDGPVYFTGRPVVFRFAGRKWDAVSSHGPRILVSPAGVPVAVSGHGEAWLAAPRPGGTTVKVIQYRGGKWSAISIPGTGQNPLAGQASYDGHHGAWFGAWHWTGSRLTNTAGRRPTGAGGIGIASALPVPGTKGAFGIGYVFGSDGQQLSVLTAYGTAP